MRVFYQWWSIKKYGLKQYLLVSHNHYERQKHSDIYFKVNYEKTQYCSDQVNLSQRANEFVLPVFA